MRFLFIFAVIALVEMATFFWVESWIGLGWALGLALATAIIGSYLVKRAGLSVLARIQRRFTRGEVPGRELSDGAAVLVAGAFLISPGFITDAFGFLLLVPLVQSIVYQVIATRLRGRFRLRTYSAQPQRQGQDVIDVDPIE